MFNKVFKTSLICAFVCVNNASAGWFSSETPKTPEVKPIAFDDSQSFDAGSDEISQYDDSASETVIQQIASLSYGGPPVSFSNIETSRIAS
jgi:hypothetical protein